MGGSDQGMATRMGILLRVSSAVPAQIIAAVWGASVLSHGGKTQRWRTRPTADKVHPTGPKTPARGHSVRCVEHTGGGTHLCWRVQHHSQVLENILDRRRAILAIRARHRTGTTLPKVATEINNPFFLKGDLKSTPAKALLYDVDLQTAPMCRCARI